DAVAQCVAVATGSEVAAFVAAAGASPVLGEQLRHELQAVLPAWAVPSRVVILDELPLDHNGKVDVPALAGMEQAASVVLPGSASQDLIVEVLRQQLGASAPPDAGTNFFDAGLTSL